MLKKLSFILFSLCACFSLSASLTSDEAETKLKEQITADVNEEARRNYSQNYSAPTIEFTRAFSLGTSLNFSARIEHKWDPDYQYFMSGRYSIERDTGLIEGERTDWQWCQRNRRRRARHYYVSVRHEPAGYQARVRQQQQQAAVFAAVAQAAGLVEEERPEYIPSYGATPPSVLRTYKLLKVVLAFGAIGGIGYLIKKMAFPEKIEDSE